MRICSNCRQSCFYIMVKAIYIRHMPKRNVRQISFVQIRYNFDVDDIGM